VEKDQKSDKSLSAAVAMVALETMDRAAIRRVRLQKPIDLRWATTARQHVEDCLSKALENTDLNEMPPDWDPARVLRRLSYCLDDDIDALP